MRREDSPASPPIAACVALANALYHRNYATAGEAVGIAIFDDHLKLQEDIKRLEDLFINGTVDTSNKDHFNQRLSESIAKVKVLDQKRVELEASLGKDMEDIDVNEVMKGIEKFSDALKKTTRVELIQSFIRSRVERVEMAKNGKEFCLKLRCGDPYRLEITWWSM